MRPALFSLIAAIMLVTVPAVARSSSHKEDKRHHHHHQQQQSQQQVADFVRQHRSWSNISSFPFAEEDVNVPLAMQNGGKKRKSAARQQNGNSGSSWSPATNKKHKKKMASLASLAEQDRRLSLLHLPQMPATSLRHSPAATQGHSGGLECCPTIVEMVQPSGGTNMEGHVVELYRHGDLDQRIYEHSCRPDVLDQPCRFVEKLLRPLSRCVQQYTFTYAVVADTPTSGSDWRLDYIRIRNGCACEIQPP